MDKNKINEMALSMIGDMLATVYECADQTDNMDHMRIMMLGEINGIVNFALGLKDALFQSTCPIRSRTEDADS